MLCPGLKTLDCTGTKFRSALFIRALKSRMRHGAALRELKITRGFSDKGIESWVSLISKLSQYDPVKWEIIEQSDDETNRESGSARVTRVFTEPV